MMVAASGDGLFLRRIRDLLVRSTPGQKARGSITLGMAYSGQGCLRSVQPNINWTSMNSGLWDTGLKLDNYKVYTSTHMENRGKLKKKNEKMKK
jgi:hypothetical protein